MAVLYDGSNMLVSPPLPWRSTPKSLTWTGDRVDFEGYSCPVGRCGKTGQLFLMVSSTDGCPQPQFRGMASQQDLLSSWK